MLRRLLSPRWLALHVLAFVAFAGLFRLGLWQWHRAEVTGRIQNYSYAVEWWLFTCFAVFLWVKSMVDSAEERTHPTAGGRPAMTAAPLVAPAVVVDDEDDPELAAYNRHLAALHARAQGRP